LYSKLAGGGWEGPLDLKVPGRRFDSRSAVTGTNSTSTEAHVAIQSELGTDDGEIYYRRIQFGPGGGGGGPLSAVARLDQTSFRSQVSLTFTSSTGDPTQVRWRWNAAPTDAENDSNGWQAFDIKTKYTVAVPQVDTSTACQTVSLYVQVRNDKAVQDPGTIAPLTGTVDRNVQAMVNAANPYMAGLPQQYTIGAADAYDPANPGRLGAYDGDPRYTRIPQFFMGIYNVNDCSGLADYAVTGSEGGAIDNGFSFEKKVTLPQGALIRPGAKTTVNIAVTDKLGNPGAFSTDLIYDPASTDTTGTQTNTLGLPILADGASVSVDTNTKSVMRTLTFSGVNVNDTVYGRNEGLPAGSQFWGVWVANATSDVGADSAGLKWFAVRVPNPDASFSVPWSIFTGLDLGADSTKPGTYFIYVRFLDGAGNPTQAAIKTSAVLDSGYSLPHLMVPGVRK
jgi:hypothetical protein